MERTGSKKPNFVVYGIHNATKYYCVNIDITEVSEGQWVWDQARLPEGTFGFEDFVSALVGLKYDESVVLRNHMTSTGDVDSQFEYEGYLIWKEEATRIAKEALKYIEENNL